MSSFEFVKKVFAKLTHPSKYKRRKAEQAERQCQELHQQAEAVRAAARIRQEQDLAKIKAAIDKVRAEIECWYAAEIAIANEQYANNKAEYEAAVSSLNTQYESKKQNLEQELIARQNIIIENSDYSDDEVFLQQCQAIIKQLDHASLQQPELSHGYQDVQAVISITREFKQKLADLATAYDELLQQVTQRWTEYEDGYQALIANLAAIRADQLSKADDLEQEQIDQIEQAYRDYMIHIDEALQKNLQAINEALAAELKQLKQIARAFIITALVIVVAAVGVYYAPVLLAGLSPYLIGSIQTTLAITGLQGIENLVNGRPSVNISVTTNVAPQPTPKKFTPAPYFKEPQPQTYDVNNFDMDALNRRFSEFESFAPANNVVNFSSAQIQNNAQESKPNYQEPKPTNINPLRNQTESLDRGYVQSILIGSGKAFVDIGHGIQQLYYEGAEKLGWVKPSTTTAFTRHIQQENDLYSHSPVGKSTIGAVGKIGTEVLFYSLLPAATVTKTYQLAATGAISAGFIAGMQPVYANSPTRSQSVLTGAAIGAVATPVFGKLYEPVKKSMVNLYEAKKINQSLGVNPFKSKSFEEIGKKLTKPGGTRKEPFILKGVDPFNGKGSFFHPRSGRKYYLDNAGKLYKGNVIERPHVDVHRINKNTGEVLESMYQLAPGSKLTDIKRRYPLEEELYTLLKPK